MSIGHDDYDFDYDNYDGQGKSLEEETDASLRVVAFVMIAATLVGGVALIALIAWVLNLKGW